MRKSFTALIVTGILMIGSVCGAENRVSLLAENQPLGEVLQSIQKASGVDVVLADKKWINDPVTCSVKNLELEKALGVVFGGYNYVLAFAADKGRVSKVFVTVYEKKVGLQGSSDETVVISSELASKLNQIAGNKQNLRGTLMAELDTIALEEKKVDNKMRLMNGLGLTEKQYREMGLAN